MSAAPQEGSILGQRYRLVRKLAEGGMGEVWVAEHLVTRRQVAIKFLKPGLGPSAHRRVIREAQAACAIEHPAAVPIHDVLDDESGAPALVMDLLSGESFEAYLRRHGKLRVDEVAPLLLPIAEALADAHGRGIVHRDLKPANVFITTSGASRLLDFGLVKEVEGATTAFAEGSVTAAGAILGTPIYMSPEQAVGDTELDGRTDVWSFGLVLYEALTGVLPTRADSFSKLLKQLLTVPIPPISSLDPTLPGPITTLLGRMLERETSARTVSMHEVADALRPFAVGALPTRPSLRSSGERPLATPPLATPPLDEVSDTLVKPAAVPAFDPLSDTFVKRLPAPAVELKTPVPTAERVLHGLPVSLPPADVSPPVATPPSPTTLPPAPVAVTVPPLPSPTTLPPAPVATTLPPPHASPATLPLPPPRRRLVPALVGVVALAALGYFALRPAPPPPAPVVAPSPTPAPAPRGLLDAPGSTVGCAVFEASGVEGTGGWLGAAVSSIACRRMQWMLGGSVARILPPPVLLDAVPGLDENAPEDPYEAPEARTRSLAAASKRAAATLDGRVDRTPSGFHVLLRLLSPSGAESARGEATGDNLFDAIDGAGRALEQAGAYVPAKRLDPEVSEGFGTANPEVAWRADRGIFDPTAAAHAEEYCRWILAQSDEKPAFLDLMRVSCRVPLADGGTAMPPPLDRSTPMNLYMGTEAHLYAGIPIPDARAVGEELAAKAAQATNPDAKAEFAQGASQILRGLPATDITTIRREAMRQVPWSAAWALLFARSGDEPSTAATRTLRRSAKLWAPFDTTDWPVEGYDEEDPAKFIRWPRRHYELARTAATALEYGRRLLFFDRTNEGRALAAPLMSGTPTERAIGTYLVVCADGTDGLPARALQVAERFFASVKTPADSDAHVRIALRSMMVAEVLGVEQAAADTWVDHYLLGEKPLLTRESYGAIGSAELCLKASAPKRVACLAAVDSIFDNQHDPLTNAYLQGARLAAALDFKGAVRAWRAILRERAMLTYMPVGILDAAGEPELSVRVDEELLSTKVYRVVRGHGLAELRMARRAFKAGDKAKARTIAKELLGAWSTLDAEVPWLPELRLMAAD